MRGAERRVLRELPVRTEELGKLSQRLPCWRAGSWCAPGAGRHPLGRGLGRVLPAWEPERRGLRRAAGQAGRLREARGAGRGDLSVLGREVLKDPDALLPPAPRSFRIQEALVPSRAPRGPLRTGQGARGLMLTHLHGTYGCGALGGAALAPLCARPAFCAWHGQPGPSGLGAVGGWAGVGVMS